MKSHARSCVVLFSLASLFASLVFGQCKCTCKPIPPGGTTRCESNQIAVCSDSGNGTCEGSCFDVPKQSAVGQADQLGFAASLLSRIFRKNISTIEIRGNRRVFAAIFDQLIDGARSNETVTLEYTRKKFAVSLGMTDASQKRLVAGRAQLAGPELF